MATRQKYIQNTKERQLRTFSDEFKRKKVRELELKITTVTEISRAYEVRPWTIYKWVNKFGNQVMKETRTIVESESDTRKMLEYKQRIAELERTIGQKQLMIDFQKKMIELAEQEYGVDIKKKFEKEQSPIFGPIGKI